MDLRAGYRAGMPQALSEEKHDRYICDAVNQLECFLRCELWHESAYASKKSLFSYEIENRPFVISSDDTHLVSVDNNAPFPYNITEDGVLIKTNDSDWKMICKRLYPVFRENNIMFVTTKDRWKGYFLFGEFIKPSEQTLPDLLSNLSPQFHHVMFL